MQKPRPAGTPRKPGAAARAIAKGRVPIAQEIRTAARRGERRASIRPQKHSRSIEEVQLGDLLEDPDERSQVGGARKPVTRTTPARLGKLHTAQARGTAATRTSSTRGKRAAKTKPTDFHLGDYIEELDDRSREVVEKLRAVIREAAPRAKETLRFGRLTWDLHGPLCYVLPASKHITLGFFHGASLEDIGGILVAGSERRMRYYRVRNADEIAPRALRQLVQQAARANNNR